MEKISGDKTDASDHVILNDDRDQLFFHSWQMYHCWAYMINLKSPFFWALQGINRFATLHEIILLTMNFFYDFGQNKVSLLICF